MIGTSRTAVESGQVGGGIIVGRRALTGFWEDPSIRKLRKGVFILCGVVIKRHTGVVATVVLISPHTTLHHLHCPHDLPEVRRNCSIAVETEMVNITLRAGDDTSHHLRAVAVQLE
jgi:hypothetical protein